MNPELSQLAKHYLVDIGVAGLVGGFMGTGVEIIQRKFLDMWNLRPMENLDPEDHKEILHKLKRTDHRDVEAYAIELFLSGLALNFAINSFQDGNFGTGVGASMFILTKMVDIGVHIYADSTIFNYLKKRYLDSNEEE